MGTNVLVLRFNWKIRQKSIAGTFEDGLKYMPSAEKSKNAQRFLFHKTTRRMIVLTKQINQATGCERGTNMFIKARWTCDNTLY